MIFTFVDQMEENTKLQLRFPYHVDNSKLSQPQPDRFPAAQCVGTFERLLKKAYNEPFAVYLTEEDRQWYSRQELELFDKVIERERQQINNGMCKIDLELEEKDIDALLMYKIANNLTFEEAIIKLLSEFVQKYDEKENTSEDGKENNPG